ncbi:hypothetical protein [Streptomyces clavifer]|uniref:hypothetical protein n=1 Tax=Streptomyces clavifer TaxID=68188 RepID=UPI0030935838|nr:hypothetical protein OG388_03120 [Streptomyces clavifer]
MYTRATTSLTTAALLLAALTACASDDGDAAESKPSSSAAVPSAKESADPPRDDAAELSDAVGYYTKAYFEGDTDTAYRALSQRCRAQITPEAHGAVVTQAAKDYGPDHEAADIGANLLGDTASVSYKVTGLPKFDKKEQPWTWEDDAWKYDAC